MLKVVWISVAIILLVAAGWKIGDIRASREATEKQRQLDEQRQGAEAKQLENSRQREAQRAGYLDLISKAAFGRLWATPRTELDTVDFAEQKQRLSVICSAQVGDFLEGRLVSVWPEIRRYAERGLLILYRIDSLQQKQPPGWEVIQSLPKDSARDAWWRKLTTQTDKAQLQTQFRETEASLNHSIGELSHTLSPLSSHDNGETIMVTYLPSWRGAYDNETLQVQNNSGVDLQNALIFVTITGNAGESLTHLHLTDHWPPGSSLTAQYLYGPRDYVNSQVLEQPARMEVVAVAQSGLHHGSYDLTPHEWDIRVKEYLARVTFQSAYLAPAIEQETGKRLGPGFQFSFSGLRKLPVHEAKIKFIAGSQFDESSWDLSSVEPDKPYSTRVNLTSEPETAELTLSFQDTTVTVTLPSGGPARISQEITKANPIAPQPQSASK